jgi:alkylresorcinol/alkylpyrone synthase
MTGEPTLVSTATAVPAHGASQAEVKARFRELLPLPARRLDAAGELFDHAAVERRHSVEPLSALGRPRGIRATQEIYRTHAVALGTEVAGEALRRAEVDPREIDICITVSCTGIMIPALEAYLGDTLGLRSDVRRVPITALGCAGGAAALGHARDFLVGFPEARALVVAVELPSLNLQPADVSIANLVSSALFGDGAAAAVLAGGGGRRRFGGVRLLERLSHLFPRSTYALGFDLGDDGFHSVLSKDVPALLKTEIARLVGVLAARRGLTRDELSCFVLHPGGRKILACAEEELGLSRADLQPSWDVLRDYGNQSSASVLFVLHEWMTKRRPPAGAHGILAAFGPGLATELALLEWAP